LVAGVGFALAVLAAFTFAFVQETSAANEHWVGTWSTAVVAHPRSVPAESAAAYQAPSTPLPQLIRSKVGFEDGGPHFANHTLRQIVDTTIGGERVRVVFSNAFGTDSLEIGSAQIALQESDSAIVAKSSMPLTFASRRSATIPAGFVLVSDPVSLTVPDFARLAIDLYLPSDSATWTSPATTHPDALQSSYVSFPGDYTGVSDLPVMTTTKAWFFLASVEVSGSAAIGAIVAFGDSITDGTRWPHELAKRLADRSLRFAVINQGISGNQLLADGAGASAIARFDRDVLAQSGATHVIVLESINDIGIGFNDPWPSVNDLILGHRQLIKRARGSGLKIYGATLTPFEGSLYWTPEGEAKRQALNEWIRTGKAYDGVIDFDAAVRDPSLPARLRPQYDPGDHLHLNDAGYRAMANSIDLGLFE
jgi:lysophospholipase L1-like esterase